MATAEAVVTCGPLRNVWCASCLAGSRYEADVYVVMASGVQRVGLFSHCPRCGPPDPDRPRGTDHG